VTEPTTQVVTRHFDRMIDQLLRIRALHEKDKQWNDNDEAEDCCGECWVPWPCDTVRILNGQNDA
jgi:hypothetical protein